MANQNHRADSHRNARFFELDLIDLEVIFKIRLSEHVEEFD